MKRSNSSLTIVGLLALVAPFVLGRIIANTYDPAERDVVVILLSVVGCIAIIGNFVANRKKTRPGFRAGLIAQGVLVIALILAVAA